MTNPAHGPLDVANPIPAGRPLRFDLTWGSGPDGEPVDLDIGCFYWAGDGSRGAVQASTRPSPDPTRTGRDLVVLSSDRTDGDAGGERLTVQRPGSVSFLVVHASIYRGPADFRHLGARVEVRSGRHQLAEVALSSPAIGLNWCAVLVLGASDAGPHLVREERYFRSAFHADRHYGLGLDWHVGQKPNPGPKSPPKG